MGKKSAGQSSAVAVKQTNLDPQVEILEGEVDRLLSKAKKHVPVESILDGTYAEREKELLNQSEQKYAVPN